ncbi:DUF397 domain-containing protein [Streptomyces sp. CB01881]|uniref:DUF397 domain-containing protein n=1 Tax=Streptomyces sp. CB01881 TaxID=2078691 RepID=UPI000CDC2615|nr:DUF397 domain-containing protein [Streptomyces sp. CB01881]AUY51622.1 DUF397 domain-containing protein [Streptomyces sp. CB01881]TYC71057.1 DUF397 domain-containing protein [Streptomyces sp. CB01881]
MDDTLWMRPTACANSNNCPEVAITSDTVYLRSSLSPSSIAQLTKDEWRVLLTGIRNGEFDV